jgi:diaminopropionate ammonia-lyase
VKDESHRLGLPAFKILGASWAVYRTLIERLNLQIEPWQDIGQLREKLQLIRPLMLVTATDGNHGRGVARVASWLGFQSKIFMPCGTVPARIEAIESEGAEVVVVKGDYAAAVHAAAGEQGPRIWLIQDTAWPGYETIPRWIVDGYSTMFWEIEDQLTTQDEPQPDVVIIQIGVGSLATAAAQFYREGGRAGIPRLIGVESAGAACALASVETGRMVTIPGPHPSVMAGLNCGTLSSIAWPVLRDRFDAFIAIDDERTFEAMRRLFQDGLVSGESGAAGAGGLLELFNGDHGMAARQHLHINASSRILLLSTEGATNPELYRRIVHDVS